MSTGQPLVSICTVTHDRSHLLPLLQDCVRQQTYPHSRMEWVIVDDSTEKTNPFSPDQDLDFVVTQIQLPQKLTLGAKRNTSHSYCRGEIIVYMDDDDWYPPTRVEHAVERLYNSEALIAGSTYLPILLLPEREIWLAGPYHQNHATANTFAFKRELLSQTEYDETCERAEEQVFLKNYSLPLVQLEPCHTVLCIGHASNSFDKRQLLSDQHKAHMEHITSDLRSSEKLCKLADQYAEALLIKPSKPRLVIVCGPSDCHSSSIAEALSILGLQDLGSYRPQDNELDRTKKLQIDKLLSTLHLVEEATLEDQAAKDRFRQAISSVANSLGNHDEYARPRMHLLESPKATMLIQEFSQYFSLQLIICLRPLGDVESPREPNSRPTRQGEIGAELIYSQLFTHIVNTPTPTHLIHYQNLLSSPAEELSRLIAALNLEPEPTMIQDALQIMRSTRHSLPKKNGASMPKANHASTDHRLQ